MRVISLLPSATELLAHLPGGLDMLVGRSHECDWPPPVLDRPAVTRSRLPASGDPAAIDAAVRAALALTPAAGEPPPAAAASLYALDERALAALRPDLILTQDLCHVCSIDLDAVRSVVSRLPEPRPRVLSLNPATIEDVLDDLLRVGEAVGLADQALARVVDLRGRMWRAIDHVNPFDDGPPGVVLEWTDPLFVAGHWTPQIVERAGGRHPLNPTAPVADAGAAVGPQQTARRAGASIRVPHEVLAASRPRWIVVCPCGVPLAGREPPGYQGPTVERLMDGLERHTWWRDLPAVRAGRVALVDGNQMFSRPGPRLVDALEWCVAWLNDRPELIPPGFPWRPWSASSRD